MNYIKGKFYDNLGNRVPLEFGNTEQIAMIDKYNAMLESDGIIQVTDGFKCFCGQHVNIPQAMWNEKHERICTCGVKYQSFTWVDEDDGVGVCPIPSIRIKT